MTDHKVLDLMIKKIIEYMDRENPFDVTLSLHCHDFGIVAHKSGTVRHAEQLGRKILDNMTDHKVLDLTIKKSYHTVTKYIRLHQMQWA